MTTKNPTRKPVPSLVHRAQLPRSPLALHLGKHFAELRPEVGEHPVDVAVDRIPEVAVHRRRLLRMSGAIGGQVKDRRMFVDYEDMRLAQAVQREEAYFDLGWAYGQIAARAEWKTVGPEARAFAQEVLAVVAASELSTGHALAALLGLARALSLSPTTETRPSRRPRAAIGARRRQDVS